MQQYVINFALTAFADFYHFVDVNEMIPNRFPIPHSQVALEVLG
jgi:hypothetical protein